MGNGCVFHLNRDLQAIKLSVPWFVVSALGSDGVCCLLLPTGGHDSLGLAEVEMDMVLLRLAD